MSTFVDDNSAFACDLYQKLTHTDGNLLIAPCSISTALAMAYAGARGDTEEQIRTTMHFSLGQEVHRAFAELVVKLDEMQKGSNITLRTANALWPQKQMPILETYQSLVRECYGVSTIPVDFENETEAARSTINGWVEEQTRKTIRDLIPPGVLDSLTRLVLVNAVYFRGNWYNRFKATMTTNAPFYITSESSVPVQMMMQNRHLKYMSLDSFEMVELPYAGNDISMIVMLPKKGDGLRELEADLSMENLRKWKKRLYGRDVRLHFPKFTIASTFRLNDTLAAMGMLDAFVATKADFSRINGIMHQLYVTAVIHRVLVEVDEEGTEAKAATGVVAHDFGGDPPVPVVFRADHPFMFLIQDRETESIIFMGRVVDPTKKGE